MPTLKQKGKAWEQAVCSHYEKQGYRLLDQNFTIRWGEIDLIMESEKEVVFIEVKVVDGIEDWNEYLSLRKFQALERAIEDYCYRREIEKEIRLDAAFVQGGNVVEIYENISNA